MLRKLLKYDFRESGRLLLPLWAGILIISALGKFMLETNLFTALPDVIQFLSVMTYVLIIFACCVGAPIYFIVFFYKNMYSDKGYITHTLPVTTHQKLLSKTISSFVMEVLTFIVCFISIAIILYDRETFAFLIRGLQSANTQFKAMTDMNFYTFLFTTLVLMLIGMLSQLLMLFASISIGQLFSGHHILGTIAGYLILNFVSQMVSSIILFAANFGSMTSDTLYISPNTIYALYGLSGCLTILLGLGCYIISYVFMEKKLNLN